MYAGPLRLARALTVGGACVALSLAGHLAGGGAGAGRVTFAGLCALAALAALLCLALGAASRRRWTFGRAVIALGLTQLVLHTAFTWLLGEGHDMGAMAGHPGAPSGVAMTLGHTVSALLVAALVATMDGSLAARSAVVTATSALASALSPWRVTSWAAGCRRHLSGVAATVSPARWARPRILTDGVVLQCLSRRGPPVRA